MSTVLIVEDNVNQRTLYTQELEDEGYKVITASDGLEATKLLAQKQVQPDIVILDLYMPRGEGIETLNQIVQLDRTLPVVIHTAYSNQKQNFLTWTAKAFLTKKSDLTELKETIKALIRTPALTTQGRMHNDVQV